MKMIQSKMKKLEWSQHFSHYMSMGIFPDTQGQLTPPSIVRSGRISNLFEMLWLPEKMKKIRSKNEGARVFTTLYINFSDAQGQITLESVVVSCRNSNSFKLSCMSLLPERMKIMAESSQLMLLINTGNYRGRTNDKLGPTKCDYFNSCTN